MRLSKKDADTGAEKVPAVTATTPEAYAANLENFVTVAKTAARTHDWCSSWFDTLAKISPALTSEYDGNERGGRKIVVAVANIPGCGGLAGMDLEADLTESGRAKYQATVTAALLADAVHVRNRVARLARDSTVTISEANDAIATLGDEEAFPRITAGDATKYSYLPQIRFTMAEGNTSSNRDMTTHVTDAFNAWLATSPVIEGAKDVKIYQEGQRADVYDADRNVNYGEMERLPR